VASGDQLGADGVFVAQQALRLPRRADDYEDDVGSGVAGQLAPDRCRSGLAALQRVDVEEGATEAPFAELVPDVGGDLRHVVPPIADEAVHPRRDQAAKPAPPSAQATVKSGRRHVLGFIERVNT
jgi:hypothetical protein